MGLSPDYAMLSVAATASRSNGVRSSPSSSPKEEEAELQGLKHLDIALALGVPFFAVVTKVCAVEKEWGLWRTTPLHCLW